MVKLSCYRRKQAQRVDRGIAVSFLDTGARRGWVVTTTPRPLYPRERPDTHYTGGWVGPRAGPDVCEKSRPHRDFFFFFFLLVSCTLVVWNCCGIRRKTACCGFFHYEKSDGFGRERTRDLGFQRPARKTPRPTKPLRTPDRPARSQSLYRLSYRAHLACESGNKKKGGNELNVVTSSTSSKFIISA
jgi:hypothetical protein